MEANLQTYITFFLTGKNRSAALESIAGKDLRATPFAEHHDLSRLRYDFPLVLLDAPVGGVYVKPLSAIIDEVLDKIAVGQGAERIRAHVVRLEAGVRTLCMDGAEGKLSALWQKAASHLAKSDKSIHESLAQAAANLTCDGQLIDCDGRAPGRVFTHIWQGAQEKRAKNARFLLNRLILKLSDILKADVASSAAGKSATRLQEAFGNGPMDRFDFAAMSRILSQKAPKERLSKARRQRIESLLKVLETQRFIALATPAEAQKLLAFTFDSCVKALKAYRERFVAMRELAKAVAIAELEIKAEYQEATHDILFAAFGENGLDESEMAIFPDMLVHVNVNKRTDAEQNALHEILSAALPIKILLQSDDVVEESPIAGERCALALKSHNLVNMAMGLINVFTLQSTSARLYQDHDAILRGLDYAGTALFSIFSGATPQMAMPAYLVAAAALATRIFPACVYDPAAGDKWANRFTLSANPQPEADWLQHSLQFADAKYQLQRETYALSFIDYIASDSRYAAHFVHLPKMHSEAALTPVEQVLPRKGRGNLDDVPYLTMIDTNNVLCKVICDEKIIREARRCLAMWNSWQELGGIRNSHVEKGINEERLRRAAEQSVQATPVLISEYNALPVITPMQAVLAEPVSEPEHHSDEAWIDTSRCASCNECIQINNKLFAYNENKQAYIADVHAGTYAQLVEAAENCQVAIIHPGKPRNPKESGLEEWRKRAEAFA